MMDQTEAENLPKKEVKIFEEPVQKSNIEFSTPKKLTKIRKGNDDFSGLNVEDIKGASVKKFRPSLKNEGYSIDGMAGQRP